MSAFYFGQKVRKVRGQWNVGHTGTVCGFDPFDPNGFMVAVRLDAASIGMRNGEIIDVPAGFEVWDSPDHLEPILPDGLESLDRINELYEPTPEVVRA